MNWRERAACNGEDPEKFFPDPSDVKGTTNALQVCVGCPVREQCLELALRAEADGLRYGVFGGLTPRQRAQVAKGKAS